MSRYQLKMLPLALSLTLSCGLAFADGGDDSNGFHAYLRTGAGGSSGTGPQSCYGLGGNTMKYRLGNECDSYFEGGTTWDQAGRHQPRHDRSGSRLRSRDRRALRS